jgi:hypothetical protein
MTRAGQSFCSRERVSQMENDLMIQNAEEDHHAFLPPIRVFTDDADRFTTRVGKINAREVLATR